MKSLFFSLILTLPFSCLEQEPKRPNIIIVFADDLGYGDVSFNGAFQIQTTKLYNLANNGLRFTNGYATSATCTPSPYALLTDQYPWRRKEANILPGTAPLIINAEQATLPKMLQSNGYQKAVIGKWHLGQGEGNVDWNTSITPGPNEVGFDYSYLLVATQDRVPTVYIEDGEVVGVNPNDPIEVSYESNFPGESTGKVNPQLVKTTWHHDHNGTIVNGIPRIGFMKGGQSARWRYDDLADTFIEGVKDYIKANKEEPFFLYYDLQQPHVPRTTQPRFVGKSGMGPRGDAILEADWCVGELVKVLEEESWLENTLIIFSSDNGPVLNDGYNDEAVGKIGQQEPNGGLRGGKYSLFEAGTRVPFFVYWKGTIEPTVSDALVSQTDILASIAALLQSEADFPDNKNLLPTFLDRATQSRESYTKEATSRTAYRKGDWVLIPHYEGPAANELADIELGNLDNYDLYNLKEDPSQEKNLATLRPEKLEEMKSSFLQERGNDFKQIEQLELK